MLLAQNEEIEATWHVADDVEDGAESGFDGLALLIEIHRLRQTCRYRCAWIFRADLHGSIAKQRRALRIVEDLRDQGCAGYVRQEHSLSPLGSRTMFLQVPEAGRIFDQGAFWDIYYEHCNYFCAASLAALAEGCGFGATSEWTGYDDQYLMLLARAGASLAGDARAQEIEALRRSVMTFSERCATAVDEWRERLRGVHRRGGSAVLWGAGSKAVAFLCATQLEIEVSCLVDINPRKHGTFAPKTGHPIVAPEQLKGSRPDVVVVMNPVYRDEIGRDLDKLGVEAEVWTL